MRAVCSADVILLDLMSLIMYCEKHKKKGPNYVILSLTSKYWGNHCALNMSCVSSPVFSSGIDIKFHIVK